MEFQTTPISGLLIIKPQVFTDSRGYFKETYSRDKFRGTPADVDYVQDNESLSVKRVLRGLHFQDGEFAQAKLVRVIEGSVYDVAVDLRAGSQTYGKWFGIELSGLNGLMMFIPRGFAHGFAVLSETARFAYKVDNAYSPAAERTIRYDDPRLNISWPEFDSGYLMSKRDTESAISLDEYENERNNIILNRK